MKNKKVLFLDMATLITIPSGDKVSRDFTDFQFRKEALMAIKSCSFQQIILLEKRCTPSLCIDKLDENREYWIYLFLMSYLDWNCTGQRAGTYLDVQPLFDTYYKAVNRGSVHYDDSDMVVVGLEDVEAKGIEHISMEDFINECNGSIKNNTSSERR